MDDRNNSKYFQSTAEQMQEWQRMEELAKWKSLAGGLAYENKMLLEHVKELHLILMDTEKVKNWYKDRYRSAYRLEYVTESSAHKLKNKQLQKDNGTQEMDYQNQSTSEVRQGNLTNSDESRRKRAHSASVPSAEKADVNQHLNICSNDRPNAMKEMYGTEANRIAGFETALQLNYEHACSKLNAKHWPELQLNLGK